MARREQVPMPAMATAQESASDERNDQLLIARSALSPWLQSDDYRALPGQLKLGVVHLLTEALNSADSPHISNHSMEDTLALTSCGAQYLSSPTENEYTPARLEAQKHRREIEHKRMDARAAALMMTWRCQRFLTHGMPPLTLNTNDFIIPEVQALRIAGGSGSKAVAEVNEDALRAEVQRYSKELRLRVIARQQELARELQRKHKEQLEMKERKKLGLRSHWGYKQ